MAVRRLSGLDTAFLAAETADNPLHVMAAMVLDPSTVPGGYSFDGFRDRLGERLGLVPPLRRRLVAMPLGLQRAIWADDPHLDLEYHLRRARLPAPGGPRELASFVAGVAERTLDRDRPLWELHVVEGLEQGHIAVVAKLHHALMDGVAGMGFMASLFSLEPEAPPLETETSPLETGPASVELRPGVFALAGSALADLALRQPAAVGRAVGGTGRAAVRLGRWLLRAPGRPTLPFTAPRTALSSVPTPRRVLASTSISLDEVRDVRKRLDATVNDVVLAVLSGALRRFLGQLGDLPDVPLVAAVPVSVRGGGGPDPANAVSVMFARLPTHLDDPLARLDAVRRETERAKQLHEAIGGDTPLELLELLWPPVLSMAARLYAGLHLAERLPPVCNLLVSNVAGPPVPLYFGGARLVALYPFGPLYDGMGLNVTVVSCEGSLGFGLVACRESVPDLSDLAAAIPEALTELRKAAGSSPAR